MTTQTTIVSAFIATMNSHRDVDEYIKHGLKFVLTPIHKILFIDERIIVEVQSLIPDEYNEYLHIIPIEFEDCYLSNHVPEIKKFNVSGNATKDTLNYMLIMNNKLEFVKRAIEINVFHSTQFIWVDFGIYHIHKSGMDEEFIQCIVNLKNNVYNKVRIGSIWESTQQLEQYYITEENIYSQIAWIFAGGVFGGDIESLLEFEKLSKEKCVHVIKEKETIMWEVNIWYMIYLENNALFSLYGCDHNLSLICNY